MNKKIGFLSLCSILIFGTALFSLSLKPASAIALVGGKTLVLYDATSGAIPDAKMMNFVDFPPGAAALSYDNAVTVLDTTTSGSNTYAGWVSMVTNTPGFPILDSTAGFQLDFTLQVENESHANNNRAGFSIIILSEKARGIELGFWKNEIWAQNDDTTGGLFKHGESAIFNTTTGLIDYRVTIVNDLYALTANNVSILTGPLRDYSKFDGFPDPYETPNFLFLGDNTTSARAAIRLGFVSVTGTERTTSAESPSLLSSPTPSPSTTSVINDIKPCSSEHHHP